MSEWPVDPILNEKLRRLVAAEVAAADARQIRPRTRPAGRARWAGAGIAIVAVAVLVAALVWRSQSMPAAGSSETPGETPTAAVSATPEGTPAASTTDGPTATLMPGLTPGPTADPALRPSQTFACSWDGGFAVALADGRVLVAGGGCQPPAIFDPNTRSFRATGSMNSERANGTATLLKDGRVLISGGRDPATSASLTTDEIYDPKTGRFTPIGPVKPQSGTTAVLLRDGRVLVVASEADSAAPDVAEVFDPASGTFTATGPLIGGPTYRSAVLLDDGRVLVANQSADQLVTTQVYDPATNSFRATLGQVGGAPCATRLPDGRVMVGDSPGLVYAYDPSSETFSRLASLSHLVGVMACTTLADGRILVIGPADDEPGSPTGLRSAEGMLFDARSTAGRRGASEYATSPYTPAGLVYDPNRDQWTYLGHLNLERLFNVGVAPLPNGGAIVIGDEPGGSEAITVELFDPKTGEFTPNE